MERIHIPASIDDAVKELNGISALLTAKEWVRAAIVYAFTRDGQGERTDLTSHRNGAKLTMTEFAAKGITGLTTRQDVGAYRNAWQKAIDAHKAVPVVPGDEIEAPDMEWKASFGSPSDQTPAVQERVARQVLRERPEAVADLMPEAIVKVIEADPEASGKIAVAVANSSAAEAVHGMVVEKHDAEREKREGRESYERPAARAVEKVIDAINHFYDTPMVVQGVSRTYREVIEFVLSNPDLVMPHWVAPTADVRTSLLRALEGIRAESARLVDALALVAGEPQE